MFKKKERKKEVQELEQEKENLTAENEGLISQIADARADSQYYGVSCRLNLQYCGSDFYWSRGRLSGKCSNQCCLPVLYHLPCYCTAGWNWQCFPCFPLSWTQRAESCRQSSGKWYCSDGDFRNYLFIGW